LDGGNTFWGRYPLTQQSRGAVIVEVMDLMGYDAMALGEVDLQLGDGILRQLIEDAHFPVLSANVIVRSTGDLFTAPYVVLERAGRRIGVIGLTGSGSYPANFAGSLTLSDEPLHLGQNETEPKAAPSPLALPPGQDAHRADGAEGLGADTLEIVDPAVSLAAYVGELEAQTNVIIVLSNLGLELNRQLSEAVPGIDLIISAGVGELVWQPEEAAETGTLLCQGGYPSANPGQVVADVTMHVDAGGRVTEHTGHFALLDDEFEDDTEVRQLLDRYQAQ